MGRLSIQKPQIISYKKVKSGVSLVNWDLPDDSDSKETACNAEDQGSIPGRGGGWGEEWERSLGEGNGNPLQYSFLGNLMNGGTWWTTVHGVAKSRTPFMD